MQENTVEEDLRTQHLSADYVNDDSSFNHHYKPMRMYEYWDYLDSDDEEMEPMSTWLANAWIWTRVERYQH